LTGADTGSEKCEDKMSFAKGGHYTSGKLRFYFHNERIIAPGPE
jgi:hypothetical protein